MKDKGIYGMELHAEIKSDTGIPFSSIIRVPGGWLYKFKNYIGKEVYRYNTCFVPYNNEFQDRE